MVERLGVAVVGRLSFFTNAQDASHLVWFAFRKKPETLEAAGEPLRARAR